ncbi:GNAT family N-acetyltransferase [Paenibacillus sp. GCM10023248]|uniref:GNAT family N-acetyltransferase n=1 Tax=Bacillales TaxID=1385 RepID=UPI002379E591|nr:MULTISPECIES: GNAT family N-acetyltransferase [Bacillales]MDD9269640.1 GNAT family N-acetyltransferase [Paenibacillus sp. MAHUQ-63]MDR6881957.1 putative acetyltransferase [Bacillus sp. 3255]
MIQNRKATDNDYDIIINLWERSVMATHHFLNFKDKEEIKKELPMYFPHLDVRLWYIEDSIIGFTAINENHLEALFLDPDKIGKGYGKQIMQICINGFGITSVDVNKQNENATRFYLKSGFGIIGEDLTDGAGRPYPILHLKYNEQQK